MTSLLFILLSIVYIASASNYQPNIILIVTDDQDLVLNGVTPLTKARNLIADQGITFSNAFCTTPICCPSRSSILTGLYTHGHGAINNSLTGGCSSSSWQKQFETRTFGKLLHDQGYYTFYAGKYLNTYGHKKAGGTSHVPPGWDWWIGLVGNSVYYNYALSVNGTRITHGDAEEDYLTDVIKQYSLDFLKQNHIIENNKGFLMAIHPPSAHAPFTAANKYKGFYKGASAPRTPNFNEPGTMKHWLLRLPPHHLPPESVEKIDEVFRNRWETLLSVDDIVEEIVNQLEKTNLLENTYIMLTSDHGFHLGQFGLPWDKRQPYETDIRIPFFMRGPNIPKKTITNHPILTVDIMPTLLEIGGVDSNISMDGESFLSKINNSNDTFNRTFLIEYHGESSHEGDNTAGCYSDQNLTLCTPDVSCKCQDVKNNTYNCVRYLSSDSNELYCQFEDDEQFIEYYDLNMDPNEMNNLQHLIKKNGQKYKEILNCFNNNVSTNIPNAFKMCKRSHFNGLVGSNYSKTSSEAVKQATR